jgi:hypothetical protein
VGALLHILGVSPEEVNPVNAPKSASRGKKLIVVGIAMVAMAGIAIPVSGAVGGESPDREPAVGEVPSPTSKPSARYLDSTNVRAARATSAGTKQKLKKLTKRVNRLENEVYDCERLVPVTQYFGYDYNNAEFQTTALDYTDAGDVIDDYVVVYVC